MATARQMEANRANANKSTGPRTEEGKAASSINRLSHGFFSKACCATGEKVEDFEALVADLISEHQPANLTEQILVEQMAMSFWLSKRAVRIQSHVFITQSNMIGDQKFGAPKDLGLLIRYKTTADNQFLKAHNQLLKLQKERKKSEIGFVPQSTPKPVRNTPAEPPKDPKTGPLPWVNSPSTGRPGPQTASAAPETVKIAL